METKYETIIIGGGFAGLYYINKFKPKNYLLIEREDRLGGRVYNTKWNGEQISLGGGVIKPSNFNLLELVRSYGLETSEFESKYELIDLPGESPNESDYYESNKIIIKYLKSIYKKNIQEIKSLKLNFDEFMLKYLDYTTYKTIKSNLLYIGYLNADVEYVLSDEVIQQLLRVEVNKLQYIKPNGYTALLEKLILEIPKSRIKLNTNVETILYNDVTESSDKNNLTPNYYVYCQDDQKYRVKKIVLATEKNPKIIINIKEINDIYNMIGSSKYVRVYGYWKSGHKLKNSIRTQNILGKVIKMSDKIMMVAYTEFYMAEKLYDLLNKNNKSDQINIIHSLMLNSGILVEKPDDLIIKFWEVGTHYPKPNTNFSDLRSRIIDVSKKYNCDMVGEIFSSYHGWVDCAIESVDMLYKEVN